MTLINETLQLQINTLTKAGIKPKAIADKLGLNCETVKTNVAKQKLLSTLPPKIKVFKGKISGRYPLQIKKYISDNPTATLEQIISAVELPCAISTLHNYLKDMDWPRVAAKREILLSAANRAKRLAFCLDMIQRGPEFYSRILWSDETMVKTHPNGEIIYFRAYQNVDERLKVKQRKVQNEKGVMFWGCISRQAYGVLTVCDGVINGDKYLDLLKEVVVPEI